MVSKILISLVSLIAIASSDAMAGYNNCMNKAGCAVTVSVDSGNTGRQCYDPGADECTCEGMYWCVNGYVATNCGGKVQVGTTVTGLKCCADSAERCPALAAEIATDVTSENAESLESTMAPSMEPLMTAVYWGYVNSTVRSPTGGRGNSAKAKLDACLFHSDVDSIEALGGTDADKYGYCTQSTYGCASTMKNEYCNANSASVCVDRCACVYPSNGVDTCNGL